MIQSVRHDATGAPQRGAPRLAVVVLNFRTPQLVINCLASFSSSISEEISRKIEIVVVDNASADDSVRLISEWISAEIRPLKIRLVTANRNGGFSAGMNIGIQTIEASAYLLTNSDTLARNGAIPALLAAMESNLSVGIFAPQIEGVNGEPQNSCFRFMSPMSEFLSAASLGWLDGLFSRWRVVMEMESVRAGVKPEWVSFAIVLIRREVLEDVGLLDEEFFMYFEDAEFCARTSDSGWGIAYIPEARFVHFQGSSSSLEAKRSKKIRLPSYYYQARTRYFYKKYGLSGPLIANIAWTLGRMLSVPRQWMGRKDKSVPASQWRDIWIHCFKPSEKYSHPEGRDGI